jgi:hypothetical protein
MTGQKRTSTRPELDRAAKPLRKATAADRQIAKLGGHGFPRLKDALRTLALTSFDLIAPVAR